MKKITILFFIITCSFSVQAQNTLTPFVDLCTACSNNNADYAAKGCRVLTGLCDIVSDDSNIAVQQENNQIQNVLFAYESQQMTYGTSAKVEIINKKGETIYQSIEGNMFFMDAEGSIYRSLSTQTQDVKLKSVEKGNSVLFSFPMAIDYKKRDKLKVKVTILKMNTSNRTLEVAATFEERL